MSTADESSNSDSSNDSRFGCLIFIRKRDGFSIPYDLMPGQITIGSADDADVRIKIPDERLQDVHCLIEIDENGIATLVNKAGDDTVRVNNQPVKKFKILQHDDMIDVIGKKFQYANENLLNNEVQTEKAVPASLSSRNRETINVFTQKRSPSKSPTFKVKSPSQRRRSVRRSSHKMSDLIIFDTPEKSSLGRKSHSRSSIHVTPKQVIYAPIVEDVSPATPPNSKDTDDVFKTPVNTPGLFEDLRKSVLQSRTRKSNKKMVSADVEKEQVINNKRGRESSVGSQRSVKRRRMMYSTDNNSEVEVLEESFESFNSEDWSEISQDQTDRDHRFSDLTRTSFAYPFSKCMSEPRLRQMKSVRLSRHNKTISVNFDGGSEPPVNRSFLLANGIREDHLVESPRPSTSNFVMATDVGSPLNHALLNKSPLVRLSASPKLKRLQESPKSDLAKIIGSPKLRSDSYISNNLSKFVGLKQLMRNRSDLSEVFAVKNLTSTPKICKSPKNDLTDVRGVKKVMSRNSPKNTLLDISGVDVLFNSPILNKSQANDPVEVFKAEKSMTNCSRLTRSPKSMINYAEDLPSPKKSVSTLKSPRTSVSATKTPTDTRKSRSTSKMSQTIENEVLDLSAVKTPHCEVLQTSASKRSSKTPITVGTPNDVEGAVESLSGSAVSVSLDTSKTKRLSRTPKKFDPSEYDLINLSKKSQVDESEDRVFETSGQKRLTRSSQCDLVESVGPKKSVSSPRPNKSLQNNILEMNRTTIDHDYAKNFNESSSTSQFADSTEGKNFETTGTRRSTRTPISKQHSDVVYGSEAKKSLSTSRTLNSSEIIDLDNCESMTSFYQYPDDDVQYVSESRKSVPASRGLYSSEIEISNTSRLRSSTRTPSANKFADGDDDDVVYVNRSRTSRSLSQTYNSPTVIDLETSRRSMRTSSADQYEDDHTAEIGLSERSVPRKSLRTSSENQNPDDDIVKDVLQTSEPRKSLRRRSTTQFANDETIEIDALETSESRKSQKTSGNNQCLQDDDDAHMSSSRKSVSEADVSERGRSRRSVRTPNGISYLDDDLAHNSDRRTRLIENRYAGYKKSRSTSRMLNSSELDVSVAGMSRRDTRTPGGTEDPEDDLMDENDSRTSMSTYRRLTKTPGSSRKSLTTSQMFLDEYDVGETSTFRRLTREPDENKYPEEEIVNISGSKKSISNSQVFDSNLYDSLESASSTRVSRSESRRLSKTPMASFSSWLHSSDLNMLETSSRRATRTPGGNAFSDEKNISGSRRSMSGSKLLDSSALHTLDKSTSKSVTEVSSGNLRPEDHIMNVSGSRVSTRLTKTPTSKKSPSTSQILNSSESDAVESGPSKRPKRTSSGDQYLDDDSRDLISPRKSNSAPKLRNSYAINTLESSMSKRSLLTSGVDEHLDDYDDDAMNVAGSRNSVPTSTRLTKTPGSSKKSISMSQIDSPARTSVVDTDITMEIGAPENSEPKRMTKTPQSVECNDVMNVSSRSRRQTRTASGSLYVEDEVMNVSMTRKSTSQISNGNECIMTASPRDTESFFAFEISKSPKNDLSNVSGIKELMKTPRIVKSPKNDLTHVVGVKKLLATPKIAKSPTNDLSDIRGVKKLLKTPRAPKSPKNDLSDIRGVKKLLKTPRAPKSPKNDLTDIRGVKKLLQTPKATKSPKNDLTDIRGVKKLLQTPKAQKSPKNDLTDISGVKKLLQTPKPAKSPKNDLTDVRGVKKLLKTPKTAKSPKNDLTKVAGLKKLMATPKVQNSPNNDLTNVAGVKKLMSTPKQTKSPKNDLSTIVPLKRLMSTPKPTKEPVNDLSNVSGVKDIFTNNQEDLFDSVFNKKPLRTYSGKFSTSKTEEQSVAEEDAVDDAHKSDLVEEWVKKQDFLGVNMENLDEVVVQESSKSTADNKTQVKKTGISKSNKLEEVGEIPVNLEKKKTRRGQKHDTNQKDLPEKEPEKQTRGKKKNDTEEANIEGNDGAIEENDQDNELVKPASRLRGKKKNEIQENEAVAEEKPKTRGKKKIAEESNTDETNAAESKSTRNMKSRSKKIDNSEGTDTEISAINEKPTRKARGKKNQAVESKKNVEEEQSKTALRINEADIGESNKKEEIITDSIRHVKFVDTADVNPDAKQSVQPRRGRNKVVENVQEQTEVIKESAVQRRGRSKATVEAIQDVKEVKASPVPVRKGRNKKASEPSEEDSKEVKESPALTRRGRNKKATEADDDHSKEVKEPLVPTKRGQIKKTVEVEDDSEVKESPAPARKGRNKKIADADKDDLEEVKEASAPVRRGRNKKASEADGDDLKEVNELPAPTRKGRNKKTTEDEADSLKKIKESPAPTRGGRNKKATEADEVSKEINESPAPAKRSRNKKASVADEDDLTEVKEVPAPTRRGRNKKAAEADEDESIKDVKEPLKRGRNKRVVEDVKEDEVKDSPAAKRARRKAVEAIAEEEPKRTRRARGDYDKYGGAFLSESPLNTKRVRGKK